MCCPLPGFDRRRWNPDHVVQIHMGAPPRYDLEPSASSDGRSDWAEPLEDAADGCPGGWYRTAWVDSILRYYRREHKGARIPNRLLDLCDDELVIEAVEYVEACEDNWDNEYERRQVAKMRAQRPQG